MENENITLEQLGAQLTLQNQMQNLQVSQNPQININEELSSNSQQSRSGESSSSGLFQTNNQINLNPLTNNEIPLTILLKFISPYSGDKAKLQTFIRNCQNAYDLASITQRRILFAYICSQLHDKAELAVSNHNFTTWLELKNFLINTYSEKKHYGLLLIELQSCRQLHNETITQYIQRIETATTKLLQSTRNTLTNDLELRGKIATINEIALHTFIIGVKPEISLILRSRGVKSLSEAHDIAVNEEKMLMFLQQNLKPKNFCTICNKTNHMAINCYRNKPNYENLKSKPKNLSINHVSPQNINTNSNKSCNYCKKMGHVISECRKRIYNNNKKLNESPTSTSSNSNSVPLNTKTNFVSVLLNPERSFIYIEVLVNESNNRRLKFLLDTGANISLVKASSLVGETPCHEDEIIKINGINKTSDPIQSIGYCYLNIYFNNDLFKRKFHIVNGESNIPLDGILGNDFFQEVGALIDYKSNSLVFKNHKISITRRNNNEINENYSINNNKNLSELFIIQPRTETFIEFNVQNPDIKQGLVPDFKILDGVYLCKSITTVNENNKALTTILNTTDKPIKINKLNLTLEPFEDDKVFQIQSQNRSYNSVDFSRNEILDKIIRTDHLNTEERESVLRICHNFNQIFHLEGDSLSFTKSITHEIPTTNQTPISAKTYRYPEIHKKEVDKQISKMLNDGIIKPSVSPWSAPLWVVPKKRDASGETKWRVVIDYRKLNSVTVGDAFPLPNITDILDQLGSSKYFTILDLSSGFHQIKVQPEDSTKTAFSTPTGHYEFTRMPFGLKNAPATFQRLMNNVLSGLQGLKCFVYLDDIVIYADSLQTHERKLQEIFSRLNMHHLKLQPDKCEFMRREVAYLGHIITNEGVKPNPERVEAIVNYPVPTNVKELKSFLGLIGYYRRFIENFSKITRCLTNLLKKNVTFNWTSTQQEAFQTLKNHLMSEKILQYPDFSKPFNLTTDASGYAIGAVLSQGTISKDLPIAFASRTLNHAESNYSTTERELLAIVWAVKHFRPYLYGRKFLIITDHRPLTWLFNVKDPGSRLTRWRLILEEYDYEIIYKEGKANSNADSLSRIRLSTLKTKEENVYSIQSHKETYDDFIKFYDTNLTPNIYDFNETKTHILDQKDHIAYCISSDIEMSEGLPLQIKDCIDNYHILSSESHEIYKILKSKSLKTKFNIYHVIIQRNYWENYSYRDFFYAFQNLKIKLLEDNISSISFPKFSNRTRNLNYDKLKQIIFFVFRNTNIKITVCSDEMITNIPREQIPIILKENHSNPISGHSGYHRTYDRIKQRYKWKHMKKDINQYIKSCESCQRNKIERKNRKIPMEITTTSSKPFQRVALDIVGPLTTTEHENKYILTLQDDLTKYSLAFALKNHESETIADHLVNKFICRFGTPACILTDQGRDFNSSLMKQVAKLFQMKQIQTSAYHPQSNGALERSHATLADYLKHYTSDKQTDWDKWLDIATFSYNTSIHASTKFTPYELVFGYKPDLPSSITRDPQFKYTYDSYIDQLKLKLNKTQQIARENLIKSKEISKKYYDKNTTPRTYNIGDKVLLSNNSSKPNLSKKLTPRFIGPYKIIKINSPTNVTIQVKNKNQNVHINRIKLYHDPLVTDISHQ